MLNYLVATAVWLFFDYTTAASNLIICNYVYVSLRISQDASCIIRRKLSGKHRIIEFRLIQCAINIDNKCYIAFQSR